MSEAKPHTQADSPSELEQVRQPGWDAMTEDIFGLSLRGLRTIWDIFQRPRAVMDAAGIDDWKSRYTPSIRLAVSLLAVMMLMRFFWAGENSPNHQVVLESFEQAVATGETTLTAEEMTEQWFTYWALLFPLWYFAIHLTGAALLRVWGRGTKFVVRSRLYFACLVPGLVMAMFSLMLMPLVPYEQIFEYSMIGLVLGAVIYWMTYMRGMGGAFSTGGRLWRATLFAAVAFTLDTTVSITTGISASLIYDWIAPTGFILDI